MKGLLLLFCKGIAMGGADVVPGVSGGTVAFITGIYERLLGSIAALPKAALLMVKRRPREAWQAINGSFLPVLLAGIVTSILTLARVISYLLEHHPIPVWSFFFGLILVSCYLVAREVRGWSVGTIVALAGGAVFAWWITVASPVQWGTDPFSLFLAGAIAICAMILPGISGSFILLLLGLYPFVLAAVKSLDIGILAVFAAGCALGLLSFAHVLKWLLQHARNLTLALLTGVMFGSLNKVWPWKQTLTWRTDSHGQQVPLLESNVLPGHFASLTGQDAQLAVAIACAVAGVLLVLVLEGVARYRDGRASAPSSV